MNVHQILDWIKANLAIVILIAVMIAAPIAMYFVSSGMNKSVRDEVQKRGGSLSQLTSINVAMPTGEQIVPTEDLLRKYEQVAKMLGDDAVSVQKRALEFNRKGRDVIRKGVFPEPPHELRMIVPKDFHNDLSAAYDKLLKDVKAGSPPDLESLRSELEGMRYRFIAQDLKKELNAALDASEVARLEQLLSDARLDKYKTAAANVGMYADRSGLFVPGWDQSRIPTAAEMFNWQWQFWVLDDVLRSLASANKDASSVADAPIKRLLGVVIGGMPRPQGSSNQTGAPATPKLSGGFGEGEGAPPPEEGGDGGAGADAGAAGGMVNPKAPLPRDYSSSLAGLVTNPLFDVLTVDMAIVVETARLPEVLDAISRYNFNTIVNLRVESADAFAATEQGFFYGSEPVSTVTIRMQTVWLREWTKQFMPPETRTALGIAPGTPAPPADPAANPAG